MGNLKSKAFWDAAFVRAVRTVCQTAIGCIGGSKLIGEVDLGMVLSASILAGVVSIMTSIVTNLPEVEDNGIH